MSFSLCGTVGGNVGGPDCDIAKARPTGLVFGGATFAAADYVDSATFKPLFVAKTKLATGDGTKLFPFPELQGNTDQTEAPKTGSLGYGLKFVLLGAVPGYEFDVVAGSMLEQNLLKFDGKTVPVYVLDSGNNTWGTRNSISGLFKGFKVLVSIIGKGFDDGQNVKSTKVTISFVSPSEFYKTAAYITTDIVISDLTGLMDGTTYEVQAHAANAYKIGIKIPTADLANTINVYDKYDDEIAGLTFTAATGPTYGTPLAITSVVKDATLKCWTVTFDNTAFTALAGGTKIKLTPPAPPVLDAADITNLELYPIIVTK